MSLEFLPGSQGRMMYGRKCEEYVADVCLIARRTLSESEHALFRLHFLLGADWQFCVPKLGLTRMYFFRKRFRIQEKLGRAFAETAPYALYPVEGYFAGELPAVMKLPGSASFLNEQEDDLGELDLPMIA